MVCASYNSWIQYDSSGLTQLGQIQGGSFIFTCNGCRKVEFLVRELAELREMLLGMTRTVREQSLEEKGGETGDREVGRGEQEYCEVFLAPDNILPEETGMERRMRTTFRQKIETPI